MSDYSEFYLGSRVNTVQLELLQITHPDFTQDYRVVRNHTQGVSVALTEGAEPTAFSYYPLRISPIGVRDNLDFSIKVDLGDMGEIIPMEIEAVSDADGFSVEPQVTYWTFRSDDLTKPLFGPLLLEVSSFSFNREASTFEAKAPTISVLRTGELYKLDRFSMLRGFL